MYFNFILSNGAQSTQRDENYPTDHTFMMPTDALKQIRSVTIHYLPNVNILGFSFFDKDGARLLWKHGHTEDYFYIKKKTVVLKENEVIVGVVAKLRKDCQSVYTDF